MQKRNELRKFIGHWIFKTTGTPNIIGREGEVLEVCKHPVKR